MVLRHDPSASLKAETCLHFLASVGHYAIPPAQQRLCISEISENFQARNDKAASGSESSVRQINVKLQSLPSRFSGVQILPLIRTKLAWNDPNPSLFPVRNCVAELLEKVYH
jgi:hypothetical protein